MLRQILTRAIHQGRAAIEQLSERHPYWDEPFLSLAGLSLIAGDLESADRYYGQALARHPAQPNVAALLGRLLIARGQAGAGRDILLRTIGQFPIRRDLRQWAGLAFELCGDGSAGETIAPASACPPIGAPNETAYGLHAGLPPDRLEQEAAYLEEAISRDPLNPTLHMALGLLSERAGRLIDAIDAYETAAALAPTSPTIARLLGRLLAGTNRIREAEAELRRAVELDPGNRPARCDHAALLLKAHRHADARARLLTAIDGDLPHQAMLCNLANAAACLGLQEEAVNLAGRAIDADPHSSLARRTLCNVLPYHQDITAATIMDALRDSDRLIPRLAPLPFANPPDPDRPLKIGLLSGSLRAHPVGWLTVAAFEALDPRAFRLACLSHGPTGSDPIARRFHTLGDWIDVSLFDDKALAQRTRDLAIDILIDLGGYGDGARMPACAQRLAPVQIKWVGSQNHSTHLWEMDWFITDRWETPPGQECLYSERLLRLADGYVCYTPPSYAPDLAPLPALERGSVTFGCFNNLAKLTPHVIRAWSTILYRVADARLVLRTHQFNDQPTADRIRTLFALHGVSPDRIALFGSAGHRELMDKYNEIDIVLDPFPYAGGLTTCESLWMGVPAITLAGETFASRHSFSHTSNVGLTDWQAADVDAYCDLAVAKAADLGALAELRAQLRPQMRASPLCNTERFGQSLAAGLRYAWREWCLETEVPPLKSGRQDRILALSD